MQEFTTYIPSRRLNLVEELQALIPDTIHVFFDENNSTCFSQIVNQLITMCPTEYMICLSDKARPTVEQMTKMKELALSGKYGCVALYRFGAFCIDKDLIRKMGFFDEGYVRGGFEDDDFVIRMREADIAIYESEEIPLIQLPSSYDYDKPYIHFKEKWAFQPKTTIRMQAEPEPPQAYVDALKVRPSERRPANFGKWEESGFFVNGHHNHQKYNNPVATFITTSIHLRTIPLPIETLPHITLLKFFASVIKPKVYVEYGVRSGICFNAIREETKEFNTKCIGVDLAPCAISTDRSFTSLDDFFKSRINKGDGTDGTDRTNTTDNLSEFYQMSTDDFSTNVLPNLNVVVDMVFIDACHTEEQCTRDFENIFPYVAEDGLIFLHDTYPYNELFTSPSYCDTAYQSAWKIRNHDFYKYRSELITIPVNPGLTIVRKSTRQLFWKTHPLTMYDLPKPY